MSYVRPSAIEVAYTAKLFSKWTTLSQNVSFLLQQRCKSAEACAVQAFFASAQRGYVLIPMATDNYLICLCKLWETEASAVSSGLLDRLIRFVLGSERENHLTVQQSLLLEALLYYIRWIFVPMQFAASLDEDRYVHQTVALKDMLPRIFVHKRMCFELLVAGRFDSASILYTVPREILRHIIAYVLVRPVSGKPLSGFDHYAAPC